MKFQVKVLGFPSGELYNSVVSALTKEQARKRVLNQLRGQFPSESDFDTMDIFKVDPFTPPGFVRYSHPNAAKRPLTGPFSFVRETAQHSIAQYLRGLGNQADLSAARLTVGQKQRTRKGSGIVPDRPDSLPRCIPGAGALLGKGAPVEHISIRF